MTTVLRADLPDSYLLHKVRSYEAPLPSCNHALPKPRACWLPQRSTFEVLLRHHQQCPAVLNGCDLACTLTYVSIDGTVECSLNGITKSLLVVLKLDKVRNQPPILFFRNFREGIMHLPHDTRKVDLASSRHRVALPICPCYRDLACLSKTH